MIGSSSLQGGHQLAMKLTHTGEPLRLVRLISPPPSCGTESGGAGCPMPKAAPGSDDASADGDGPRVGEGPGVAVASATGSGDKPGSYATGPGVRSTTAPTTIAPVTSPATRPPAIAVFPPILASVPVRPDRG